MTTTTVVTGTAGADGIRGNGKGQVLQGGAGDDTYFITSARDGAQEAPGAGVDTVHASNAHVLEPNVENLTLDGSAAFGKGNALANIITGSAAGQTLDGAGGADVLVGGGGADIFVQSRGSGRDVIVDFAPGVDRVRLEGFSFSSFTKLQAAMTQSGADVALDLGGGDGLVFRNHAIADFHAGDFQLSIDTQALTQTFDDEFSGPLSLDLGAGGTWRTTLGYGGSSAMNNRHLSDEAQVYTDPAWTGTDGHMTPINPFSVQNGVLNITETKLTAVQSAENWGLGYASGLVTTKSSFSQLYGYFEMSAKLPAGQGMRPAFWLLPANGAWPPELDVMEEIGRDPSTVYQTLHTGISSAGTQIVQQVVAQTDDLTAGFHRYGVLWTASDIVWYVDGVETGRVATPDNLHTPMYMLVNLAVGGTWGGGTTAVTPSGASLQVDYVRAYSLPDAAPAEPAPPPPPPPPAPSPDAPIASARVLTTTSATDHLTVRLGDLDLSATGVQLVIKGFSGAGAWTLTNNDWLSLTGFSTGSTLTFDHTSTADPAVSIYALHDAASGHTFLVGVGADANAHLAKGDYGFF